MDISEEILKIANDRRRFWELPDSENQMDDIKSKHFLLWHAITQYQVNKMMLDAICLSVIDEDLYRN